MKFGSLKWFKVRGPIPGYLGLVQTQILESVGGSRYPSLIVSDFGCVSS